MNTVQEFYTNLLKINKSRKECEIKPLQNQLACLEELLKNCNTEIDSLKELALLSDNMRIKKELYGFAESQLKEKNVFKESLTYEIARTIEILDGVLRRIIYYDKKINLIFKMKDL